MKFSQRIGKTPVTKLAQRESIDDELRNSLWNALTLHYWNWFKASDSYIAHESVRGSNLEPLVVALWVHFFKKPIDTINKDWSNCLARLRQFFFEAPWFGVFDFIETVAEHGWTGRKNTFIKECNLFLDRENSAYRFIDDRIGEITSQNEIDEVESAMASAKPYAGVTTHLSSALSHLTNRTNPDFRNSIKESISAVESLAKQLSGDQSATLGAVLKSLEKSHALHPALKNAFSSLYGYTNDSHGIRHALMDQDTLTKADAKFMLVCCSAFVNYAIQSLSQQ
jgi:hypothetical protein